jgi:smad nuclear-interacting protein 1
MHLEEADSTLATNMDSSKSSRLEQNSRHTHRTSPSPLDSEGDRRRRDRREEDQADRDQRTSRRHDERGVGREDDRGSRHAQHSRRHEETKRRDTYDDQRTKRRRSRSPALDSSRRRRDEHETKHRSSRDRSPHRSGRDHGMRTSREASENPVSRKSKGPLPSQAISFQSHGDPNSAMVLAEGKEPVEKETANFAPSGLLAAASNSVTQADGTSIALKYHEPPEARKAPAKDDWKLFVFKGPDILETIDLSTRSCWLVGREVAVVDMPAEHPSISKQHAVIQFRYIEKKNEYGDRVGRVRPYLIDLDSANGSLLNKEEVPPTRYLELRDKDMVQFGHSTREYVLMLSPRG